MSFSLSRRGQGCDFHPRRRERKFPSELPSRYCFHNDRRCGPDESQSNVSSHCSSTVNVSSWYESMITITFIRHGQSEDNPRGIWAGWKDAPLSELGIRQAKALGDHLSTTRIDLIYSSPLLRARQTGEAVQSSQSIPPALITNPHLREQHWGIAEGHPACSHAPLNVTHEEAFKVGIFPRTALLDNDGRFPGGE